MWEPLACMNCGAKVRRSMKQCPNCNRLPLPRIDSRFEQLECLASHDGSTSLRVRDHAEHCDAFMRVLTPRSSPVSRKALEMEAHLLEHLAGVPGFPRYVWAAEDDEGHTYLVRSLVKGIPSKNALAWRSPAVIIEGYLEMFRAVAVLHAMNLVHTALAPDSFLLSDTGSATMIDLRPVQPVGSRALGTGIGRHRAPEQVANLGPISPAADVFALGVMLYRSLTGEYPFPRNPKKMLKPGIRPRAPSSFNANISPALDAVILQALEKQPDKRFADAGAFAAALNYSYGEATDPDAGGPGFSFTLMSLLNAIAALPSRAFKAYMSVLSRVTHYAPGKVALWHVIALAAIGLVSVAGWAVFGHSRTQADMALEIPGWREEAVRVQFLCWPAARVYVDGNYFVEAPSPSPYLLVGPRHNIEFISRDGRHARLSLDVELGKSYKVKCNLDRGYVHAEEFR